MRILSVKFSFTYAAALIFCSAASGQDMAGVSEQLRVPFEKKFESVTSSLSGLSKKNLYNIEAALSQNKRLLPTKTFEKQIFQVRKSLVVQHSTSVQRAISVLNQNAIFSLDELVREGIVDKNVLKTSRSSESSDAKIGEQDVVFLAVQSKNKPFDQFGSVAFRFDLNRTLLKGYFSLSSFTLGSPYMSTSKQQTLDEKIEAYRPIIFYGEKAFESLIGFILQNNVFLRSKSNFLESIVEQIQDENKLCSVLFDLGQENNLCLREDEKTILEPAGLSKLNFNLMRFSAASSLESQVIRGALLLPAFNNSVVPFLFREDHDFWELKIPRKLTLENLDSIVYRKNGNEDSNLKEDILIFAKKHHWKVKLKAVDFDRVEFQFIKGRDTSHAL